MKHKHADVIKAWADGDQVQYKVDEEWFNHVGIGTPSFNPSLEWRVKPQKRKYRVAMFTNGQDIWTTTEDDTHANAAPKSSFFVRYLTDWIEYDPQ